ncbi:MAG: hypothetical protein ABI318_09060 [Chthoniobacteraceae bacterium]
MKPNSPRSRSVLFPFIAVAALMLAGCAGPITRPSEMMSKTGRPAVVASPGKSLVLFHRPRNHQGWPLYTGVWDSTHFIGDLGNGHSIAYECNPGTHYFINRSVERVGVIEAKLLPNQTYDIRTNIAGAFIASFQIEPMKAGDRERKRLGDWEEKHAWMTRATRADGYESAKQGDIQEVLRDFVSGAKRDRVRHLGADDHR